jgi:hypothetical protein
MSDWIGLGILIALALCALLFLRYLSKPKTITPEEFERRAEEGQTLVGAGMMELQKFLDPSVENAIVATQEIKQGKYSKKKNQGDGEDETGSEEENND